MSADDNVIPFPFKKRGEGDLPAAPVKKAKTASLPFCSAHMFEVDEERREVLCSRCSRAFDAFEALGLLARDWSNYDWSHRSARHEIADLEKERDAIKKQVSNLKAQRRHLVPNVRVAIQRATSNLFRASNEKSGDVRSSLLREAGRAMEHVQKTIDAFGKDDSASAQGESAVRT
jgi:predicted  nucleic acid-binding Zn-ribbon protein